MKLPISLMIDIIWGGYDIKKHTRQDNLSFKTNFSIRISFLRMILFHPYRVYFYLLVKH